VRLSRSAGVLLVLLGGLAVTGPAPGSGRDQPQRRSRSNADTTPPTLTMSNITTAATFDCGESFCANVDPKSTAIVSDPDDSADQIRVICNNVNGSQFYWGMTNVTCQAWDAANNFSGPVSVTVTVTVPLPSFQNVPSPVTFQATGPAGAVVTFVPPTAIDVGGRSVPVTCDHISGITYPLGTTIVGCSAALTRMDTAGNPINVNSSATQFSVIVTNASAPTTTATTPTVVTTTASPSPTTPATATPTSPTTTALPARRDTTAPTIAPKADFTVNATSAAGAVVAYTASATDPDDPPGGVLVTCSPAPGSLFRIGPTAQTRTTTVHCDARDAAGNAAVRTSFKITVRGAHDQLTALQAQVIVAGGVPRRDRASLASKVLEADLYFASGHVKAGISQLASFMRSVRKSPRIPPSRKADWLRDATRIDAVILG